METNHLFKNVRTLAMALTLCAAFAAAMLAGCKKDETPEQTPELTQSVTFENPYQVTFSCKYPSSSFSKVGFFVIDTVPDPQKEYKPTQSQAGTFSLESFKLTPGKKIYWRARVKEYAKEAGKCTEYAGPVESLTAQAWPDFNMKIKVTTYSAALTGTVPDDVDPANVRVIACPLSNTPKDVAINGRQFRFDAPCESVSGWGIYVAFSIRIICYDTDSLYYLPIKLNDYEEDVQIPDKNFRDYVVAKYGSGGKLSSAQAEAVRSLDLSNLGIESFEGLGYFRFLDTLDVSGNPMKSIEVKQNAVSYREVENWWYYSHGFHELTCSDCPNLEYAYFHTDFTRCNNNPKLRIIDYYTTHLDCTDNDALDTLYLSGVFKDLEDQVKKDAHTVKVADYERFRWK